MLEAQNAKYFQALPPISLAGAATATVTEIDTLGFAFLELIVCLGLVGATGIATVKIQESDTSGSGYVDITGAAFTALVDADDNKVLGCFMSLKARKRYLNVVVTNGATNASLVNVLARLSRGQNVPKDATSRGLAQQLNV